MKVVETELPGVVLVEPDVHGDARGLFYEAYHQRKFAAAGLSAVFVQDNYSRSIQGTLRGLHAQLKKPQGKLVRVVEGEVFDVAVDIRVSSPRFGRWVGVTLKADAPRMVYIPPGFAHGFCVVGERAAVEYKCTEFYDPADEIVVLWNDPKIGVSWPVKEPLLSKRDRDASRLEDLLDRLPRYS